MTPARPQTRDLFKIESKTSLPGSASQDLAAKMWQSRFGSQDQEGAVGGGWCRRVGEHGGGRAARGRTGEQYTKYAKYTNYK